MLNYSNELEKLSDGSRSRSLTDEGNRSFLAEIPRKLREPAELLGMEPDLFSKGVPS